MLNSSKRSLCALAEIRVPLAVILARVGSILANGAIESFDLYRFAIPILVVTMEVLFRLFQ